MFINKKIQFNKKSYIYYISQNFGSTKKRNGGPENIIEKKIHYCLRHRTGQVGVGGQSNLQVHVSEQRVCSGEIPS